MWKAATWAPASVRWWRSGRLPLARALRVCRETQFPEFLGLGLGSPEGVEEQRVDVLGGEELVLDEGDEDPCVALVERTCSFR
ncbi:MAG: hypothetical protein ACRDI0_04950 [Actinomycetota bacterium]